MGRLSDALDSAVDAAGRYWAIPAAVFGAVGAIGAPALPVEAVPWAALAGGFVVYAAGYSVGRRAGEESGEARERARVDRETDGKIRLMRAQAEIEDRRAAEEQAVALAERAEEDRRRAAEVESRISMFSDRQLDLMLRVADAEDSVGYLSVGYGTEDDALAMHLMGCQVMLYGDPAKGGRYHWMLFANWSQFVRENRAAIEARISRPGDGEGVSA